jgi:hypothetical protein
MKNLKLQLVVLTPPLWAFGPRPTARLSPAPTPALTPAIPPRTAAPRPCSTSLAARRRLTFSSIWRHFRLGTRPTSMVLTLSTVFNVPLTIADKK